MSVCKDFPVRRFPFPVAAEKFPFGRGKFPIGRTRELLRNALMIVVKNARQSAESPIFPG
jgi:hypothetical protein